MGVQIQLNELINRMSFPSAIVGYEHMIYNLGN